MKFDAFSPFLLVTPLSSILLKTVTNLHSDILLKQLINVI